MAKRSAAASVMAWAAASSARTSVGLWCIRGSGRAGPRMPARVLERSIPSLTAHETAERSTNQRPDTVGTDSPASCHRHIAAQTSPAVNVTMRRRPKSSAIRARTTWRCDLTVAGFHRCGASKKRSISSATVSRAASVVKFTRLTPKSATSSWRRRCAASSSPWTVNERCTLWRPTGSKPTTTRISHTPGRRWRSDPCPRLARPDSTPSSLQLAAIPTVIGFLIGMPLGETSPKEARQGPDLHRCQRARRDSNPQPSDP